MKKNKTTITLFHCINAFTESDAAPFADHPDYEMKFVAMACSGMVKDVFLLRAFEAGSEAVVVLVCPDDQCRHVEGSLRARKRVERTKQILEEIGMDPLCLSIYNIASNDQFALRKIVQHTAKKLSARTPIKEAA